jgi:hypothetical protein
MIGSPISPISLESRDQVRSHLRNFAAFVSLSIWTVPGQGRAFGCVPAGSSGNGLVAQLVRARA